MRLYFAKYTNHRFFFVSTLVLGAYILSAYFDGRYHIREIGEEDRAASLLDDDEAMEHFPKRVSDNPTAYLEAKFGNSCYKPSVYYTWVKDFILSSDMKRSDQPDCQNRLPNVIMIGAKKCASDALRDFLVLHPSIVYGRAPEYVDDVFVSGSGETHFFDRHYQRGIDFYRNLFPFSRPGDTLVEKTPQYLNFPDDAPAKIYNEVGKDTKIVAIICDPIRRAVSDYVMEHKRETYKKFVPMMHYRIKDTFEESVLEYDRFENIDTNNDLIKIGMYAYHLARWVRYFPLSQIYLVDGGVFKTDPVKELKNLERFLQLPRYFKKEHFFLHPKTNLYCSAFPIKRCLDKRQKGLRHPDVSDKIVKRLRDFYRAYDNQLSMMFNRTFTWMDEDV